MSVQMEMHLHSRAGVILSLQPALSSSAESRCSICLDVATPKSMLPFPGIQRSTFQAVLDPLTSRGSHGFMFEGQAGHLGASYSKD